jgi:hypothetical protein
MLAFIQGVLRIYQSVYAMIEGKFLFLKKMAELSACVNWA